MAHFAKLDENNIVLEVIVIHNNELLDENGNETEAKGLEFVVNWSGGYQNWKQTSYNKNFRNKFATSGDVYMPEYDVFVSAKPYPSWSLDTQTFLWEAPVLQPEMGLWNWDEPTQQWISDMAINLEIV
jgi:hypothetical protein